MGNIGEEYEFCLYSLLKLPVEFLLGIALLLKYLVLFEQRFLMALVLPIYPECKEYYAHHKNNDSDAGIKESGLRRMLSPIIVDLVFEDSHFAGLLFHRLILEEQYICVGDIHGR